MSEKSYFNFNIFYLAVCLIWQVVRSFYLHIDAAGRVEAMMTVIAIIVNGKGLLKCPGVMKIWILWVLYCFINLLVKGLNLPLTSLPIWTLVHLFLPLTAMLAVYRCAIYDYKGLVRFLSLLFLFFVVVGFFNVGNTENINDRYTNDMGNYFFNASIMLIPFVILSVHEHKNNGYENNLLVYAAILFLLFILVLSGERKALFGLIIIIAGYVLAKGSKLKASSIIMIILLLVASYFILPKILEHTIAGQRMTEQMNESQFSDNVFLKIMGDRAVMYMEGFDLFLENKLTGIGLTNYLQYGSLPFPLHTEYMVQLTECGIIGSVLFLIFYFGMIIRLTKLFKEEKQYRFDLFVFAGTLLAILEINFTAWTYDVFPYFMFFGLLFARCDMLLGRKHGKKYVISEAHLRSINVGVR